MERLILVRHGESEHNTGGVLSGQIDAELTEEGVRQAEKVAERLAEEEDIDTVYSSDLERARKTAEHIAEGSGVELEETDKLRERTFGIYDSESPEKRREELDSGDKLDDWRPEDGENLRDVKDRALEAVDEIEESHGGETVAIVAHAWTNRAIITGLLESGSGHAHQITQDNTCINVFEKEEFRGWRLRSVNDVQHLDRRP